MEDGEMGIFINTSLGTHLALAVPPDIPAAHLKRDLEKVHLHCFPEMGEIKVSEIMVKRKSHLYRLPDSFPIKLVFRSSKGAKFLHANASTLSASGRSAVHADTVTFAEVRFNTSINGNSKGPNAESHMKTDTFIRGGNEVAGGFLEPELISLSKKKKIQSHNIFDVHIKEMNEKEIQMSCERIYSPDNAGIQREDLYTSRMENKPREERNSGSGQNASERSSEVGSVTRIINRYFSDFEEVSQCGNFSHSVDGGEVIENQQEEPLPRKDSNIESRICSTPQRALIFPFSEDISPRRSGSMVEKVDVGARFLTASTKLGVHSRNKPMISVFSLTDDGKHFGKNYSFVDKKTVFEISRNND